MQPRGLNDVMRGTRFEVCFQKGLVTASHIALGSLILILLLEGTHRFSELARGIGGVSEKMLAQSLQALEADGFVVRKVYPTVPPKVEYSLTPLGSSARDE